MSALEIEQAIRDLPPDQAKALAQRLQDMDGAEKKPTLHLSMDQLIKKYRVREGWAAGLTTEQYLRTIRGGDRD